jgi:hypothetical protein
MHSTHSCGSDVVLQSFPPVQSAFVVQGSIWQTPIVPSSFEQYLPLAQWVAPSTLRQPGVHVPVTTCDVSQMSSAGQLVSPAQPATHWWLVVSQTSGAVQSALPTHATHVFEIESHLGVAPLQVVPSTHPTHWPTLAPVVTQAGPPVVPVQSAALVQAWQM